MKKRICITGSSGTGKTKLAKWISEFYHIPYVNTSAKLIWKKYGIKNHKDLLKMVKLDEKFAVEYQHRILNMRTKILMNHDEFVTDRGPLDNIAYYLLECSAFETTRATEYFIEKAMILYSEQLTHQIILPFTEDTPLEDDGYRITNIYYQTMVDIMIHYLVKNYAMKIPNVEIKVIIGWSFKKRQDIIMSFLSNLYLNKNGS